MTEPVRCSDFVQRCRDTMAEYERLRFLGIGHDIAIVQSGFRDAVMNRPVEQRQLLRDVRAIVAGDADA